MAADKQARDIIAQASMVCHQAGYHDLGDGLDNIVEPALALIESQRATIERVERELVAKKAECEVWRVEAEDLKALDAHAEWVRLDALLSEEYEKTEAFEARVTALEAEKAKFERIIGHRDRRIARLVEAMEFARSKGVVFPADSEPPLVLSAQALSRSSTEVKNDGSV